MIEFEIDHRKTVPFGRRRIVPRVCVVDVKLHVRTFLADTLEELGFIPRPCEKLLDVSAALSEFDPDLVVIGLLKPESDVTKTLHLLKSSGFTGRVMLFGGRASTALLALHELGEQIGLAMLPPLGTPFRESDLHENLALFLPIPESPHLEIDVEEALRNNWLELWYQPKIDLREMAVIGAEALVRMRHPSWGIVPPASFLPQPGDPTLRSLSEFVFRRAMTDWRLFTSDQSPVEMTIHLPAAILEDGTFIEHMCLDLPDHAARARLFVEITSADVRRDHARVRQAARQLDRFNVGVSIDDVMAETSWIDVADFPVAEIQVDGSFIKGCAHDSAKRKACEMALDIARRLQARSVAKSLEDTADCRVVCRMGFDVGQGFLFAKPMEAHRFARTMLRRQRTSPAS